MRINMKIRNGFVSNSSSSSFVIFGKILDDCDLERIFKFTPDDMKRIEEYGLYEFENTNLKDVDFISLSGGEQFIIGKNLKGNATSIIERVFDTEKILGSGCIVYRGVNQDGECFLDD
jgi:hypothetical protein